MSEDEVAKAKPLRKKRPKRAKPRSKKAIEGLDYVKVEERYPGFDPTIEPKKAVPLIEARNDRGFDVETFRDTVPPNYFHMGLFGKGYPPAKKVEACTAWWATGSFERAERMTGVPRSTIKGWHDKAEWWQVLTQEIRKEHNEEMEAKLTGLQFQALEEIENRLAEGDHVYVARDDKLVRKPIGGKDLSVIYNFLFEKRALLRGDPTAKIEKVTTDQRLSKLQQEFKKFSKAKTIKGERVLEEDGEDNAE